MKTNLYTLTLGVIYLTYTVSAHLLDRTKAIT